MKIMTCPECKKKHEPDQRQMLVSGTYPSCWAPIPKQLVVITAEDLLFYFESASHIQGGCAQLYGKPCTCGLREIQWGLKTFVDTMKQFEEVFEIWITAT